MENLIILEIENIVDCPKYMTEGQNKPWFETIPDNSDSPFICIFAVIEEIVIGRARFFQTNDINGEKWYYGMLEVIDEYWRRGIAQSMVETGLENLRRKGAKKVCCDVRRSNIASVKLHEKLSFQINNNEKPPNNWWMQEGSDIYERIL